VPTGARDGAGRPSLRVQPRADRFVALAAQLQVNDVTVARVGLGGAVLDRATVGLPPGRCPDQVAATVTSQVAELAERAGADATVVGLGVSVPAWWDAVTGWFARRPTWAGPTRRSPPC
jgi:hypothetical protein